MVSFDANRSYEWRVPLDDEATLYTESNDYIRMNADGGYSLLGKWRLNNDLLELDMLGETDRYRLDFSSETSFRIVGPDSFSCELQ